MSRIIISVGRKGKMGKIKKARKKLGKKRKQIEKENFPLACWAPIPTQMFLGLEGKGRKWMVWINEDWRRED